MAKGKVTQMPDKKVRGNSGSVESGGVGASATVHITNMSLPSQVLRRLTKEIVRLQRSPPEGIGIDVGEQDILDVNGWIQGPAGTPYEGGYFRVRFDFTSDFPSSPPRCLLKTKIFHPNIHSSGEICVSTLKKDWSSQYGIEHILLVIKCLLITPNPDSALDAEAGRLLQDAYSEYASTASVWTRIHASHCPPCLSRYTSPEVAATTSTTSTATATTLHIPQASSKADEEQQHGEGPSIARPLELSGSSNTASSYSPTCIGSTLAAAPMTRVETNSGGGLQKRKSDDILPFEPSIGRKKRSMVKRGIKRL